LATSRAPPRRRFVGTARDLSPGKTMATASAGIAIRVLICAAGWFAATRGDYAKLAAAQTCYGTGSQLQSSSPQCAAVKPSDALSYKAAIDRKTFVSRLGPSFGVTAAIALLIVRRGRRRGWGVNA